MAAYFLLLVVKNWNYYICFCRNSQKCAVLLFLNCWCSVSARLFWLFEPKKRVLKKTQPTFAFGKLRTQLFYKSCILSIEKKLRTNAEGIMDPQGSINENALCTFCILPLQTRKIPKYPSVLSRPHLSSVSFFFVFFLFVFLCFFTGLPPQSTKPISTFDIPNTKLTKPNQK